MAYELDLDQRANLDIEEVHPNRAAPVWLVGKNFRWSPFGDKLAWRGRIFRAGGF